MPPSHADLQHICMTYMKHTHAQRTFCRSSASSALRSVGCQGWCACKAACNSLHFHSISVLCVCVCVKIAFIYFYFRCICLPAHTTSWFTTCQLHAITTINNNTNTLPIGNSCMCMLVSSSVGGLAFKKIIFFSVLSRLNWASYCKLYMQHCKCGAQPTRILSLNLRKGLLPLPTCHKLMRTPLPHNPVTFNVSTFAHWLLFTCLGKPCFAV